MDTTQILQCDLRWYQHRLKLLRERRVSELAIGTVAGWKLALKTMDSIHAIERRIQAINGAMLSTRHNRTAV